MEGDIHVIKDIPIYLLSDFFINVNSYQIVVRFNSGRILIALIDLVLWIGIYDADGFSFILILAVLAAIALFLLLIALNHQTVENGLHAVLMSLWQMLAVLAVIMIWYEMTRDKKGK